MMDELIAVKHQVDEPSFNLLYACDDYTILASLLQLRYVDNSNLSLTCYILLRFTCFVVVVVVSVIVYHYLQMFSPTHLHNYCYCNNDKPIKQSVVTITACLPE